MFFSKLLKLSQFKDFLTLDAGLDGLDNSKQSIEKSHGKELCSRSCVEKLQEHLDSIQTDSSSSLKPSLVKSPSCSGKQQNKIYLMISGLISIFQ